MSRLARAAEALERVVGSGGRLLLGLDFDGTLARLAPRPHLVRIDPRTRRVLRDLCSLPRLSVAVLSGRSLRDVRAKVRVRAAFYAGNHGLEIEGPGFRWTHPRAAAWERALRAVAARLDSLPREFRGVDVETKGLSVSVHFRRSGGAGTRRALRRRVAARIGPQGGVVRIVPGEKLWELRPRSAWDKGLALRKIAASLPGRWALAFIGDDWTDEEGFRSLGRDALTVRVGPGTTSARFRLGGPAEVAGLLSRLAQARRGLAAGSCALSGGGYTMTRATPPCYWRR